MRTQLIFDSTLNGHHLDYLRAVLEYCETSPVVGNSEQVIFMVPAEFESLVSKTSSPGISFRYLTNDEMRLLNNAKIRARSYLELTLIAEVTRQRKVDEVFLMNLEYFQAALASRSADKPHCPISGIMFQPYTRFEMVATEKGFLAGEYFKAKRKRYRLLQMLKNSNINRLCIPCDQAAVDLLRSRHAGMAVFKMLPEPYFVGVTACKTKIDIRNKYAIGAGNKLLLVFGYIIPRKNIPAILDALTLRKKNTHQRLTLLVIGNAKASYRDQLKSRFESFQRSGTADQVIFDSEYADAEVMDAAFAQCDIVLMPYLKAYQSSGILFLAARHNKPVISADTGLMNELVNQHELGKTVDAQTPEQICQAIDSLLEEEFTLDQSNDFFSLHTPERHAACIVDY